MLTFRVSPLRGGLVVIAAVLLAYLCVAVGLTFSPSTVITNDQSSYDIRLTGLSKKGSFIGEFTFDDPRIVRRSARVRVQASEIDGRGRPIALAIELREPCGLHVKVRATSHLTTPLRFDALFVEPRFGILLPTLAFAWRSVVLIASLLVAIVAVTFSREQRTVAALPALAFAIVTIAALQANRIDYWPRAFWLLSSILLLLAGLALYRLTPPRMIELTGKAVERQIWFAVGLITLAGLVLRFTGLDFGIPNFFHPDEGRKVKIVQHMIASGDLNPHYFRHPSFLLYATFLLGKIHALLYDAVPELATLTYLGRSVSATLGALSIPILFLITRALFQSYAALLAALFFAVAPLHVACSRYMKEDSAMLFFTLCGVYFTLQAVQNTAGSPRGRHLAIILSGVFAGAAVATKYSGLLNLVFVAIPGGLAIFAALNERFLSGTKIYLPHFGAAYLRNTTLVSLLRATLAALLAYGLTFLAITPYALLDAPKFLTDFFGETTHMERGHTVAITALSYYWMYHVRFSLIPGLTAPLYFAALLGCGYLVARKRFEDLFVLGAILLYYGPAEWVKAKPQPQPERYVLPCIPFLCAAGAVALRSVYTWLTSHAPPPRRLYRKFTSRSLMVFLTALLAAIVFFLPAQFSIRHALSLNSDTRLLAGEWIKTHIPAGAPIVIEWKHYAPPIDRRRNPVIELKDRVSNKLLRGLYAHNLREAGGEYLIISSFFYDRYLNPLFRAHNLRPRYQQLLAELPLVAKFEDPELRYGFHHPTILILSLKDPCPSNDCQSADRQPPS